MRNAAHKAKVAKGKDGDSNPETVQAIVGASSQYVQGMSGTLAVRQHRGGPVFPITM